MIALKNCHDFTHLVLIKKNSRSDPPVCLLIKPRNIFWGGGVGRGAVLFVPQFSVERTWTLAESTNYYQIKRDLSSIIFFTMWRFQNYIYFHVIGCFFFGGGWGIWIYSFNWKYILCLLFKVFNCILYAINEKIKII